MLESLLLKFLDFALTIPAVFLTILFNVIQPALWVIIPLWLINKIMVALFNTSLIDLTKRRA
tara:strand:- start:146 stop:331 length:186 start_codon:yes stop_codon:yes gene_type:complete